MLTSAPTKWACTLSAMFAGAVLIPLEPSGVPITSFCTQIMGKTRPIISCPYAFPVMQEQEVRPLWILLELPNGNAFPTDTSE